MSHQGSDAALGEGVVPPVGDLLKGQGFAGGGAVVFDHHKVAQPLLDHPLGVGVVGPQRGLGVGKINAALLLVGGGPHRADRQPHRQRSVCLLRSLAGSLDQQGGALGHVGVHADVGPGLGEGRIAVVGFRVEVAVQQQPVQLAARHDVLHLLGTLVQRLRIHRADVAHPSAAPHHKGEVMDAVQRQPRLVCAVVQIAQRVEGGHHARRLPEGAIGVFQRNKQGVQPQLRRVLHHLVDLVAHLLLVNLRRVEGLLLLQLLLLTRQRQLRLLDMAGQHGQKLAPRLDHRRLHVRRELEAGRRHHRILLRL